MKWSKTVLRCGSWISQVWLRLGNEQLSIISMLSMADWMWWTKLSSKWRDVGQELNHGGLWKGKKIRRLRSFELKTHLKIRYEIIFYEQRWQLDVSACYMVLHKERNGNLNMTSTTFIRKRAVSVVFINFYLAMRIFITARDVTV